MPAAAPIATARLLTKGYYRRVLAVTVDQQALRLEYNGRGVGTEWVYVDGTEVAKRRRRDVLMSHEFRFEIARLPALLSVRIPWWQEVVPWGTFELFVLWLEGKLLYAEGATVRCFSCGYDLHGLCDAGCVRCPECGHTFR